ncbi:MAG: hypothetical protein ACLSAF_07780 [Intestinimonas sp.]
MADLHGGRQRRPLRRGPGHGLMERADFAAWCAAVCRHIRYRPARAQAAAELMDHLTDHAAALEDAGAAPGGGGPDGPGRHGGTPRWAGPWTGPIRPCCAPPWPSPGPAPSCCPWQPACSCFRSCSERLGSADLPAGEEHPRGDRPRRRGDTAARIGNKVVVVTDVVQTRDGTLSVCLLEFNVPPILNSFGFYGFQVRDGSGRTYLGGGQSSGASFAAASTPYRDFPPTDSVTLLYDEPGRACQFTIPLEVGP